MREICPSVEVPAQVDSEALTPECGTLTQHGSGRCELQHNHNAGEMEDLRELHQVTPPPAPCHPPPPWLHDTLHVDVQGKLRLHV